MVLLHTSISEKGKTWCGTGLALTASSSWLCSPFFMTFPDFVLLWPSQYILPPYLLNFTHPPPPNAEGLPYLMLIWTYNSSIWNIKLKITSGRLFSLRVHINLSLRSSRKLRLSKKIQLHDFYFLLNCKPKCHFNYSSKRPILCYPSRLYKFTT